jgi:hypothetical protein
VVGIAIALYMLPRDLLCLSCLSLILLHILVCPQGAALSLLQNMAMVTGVPPLIRWLQRFRFDPQQPGADMDSLPSHSAASTTASLVLGAGMCCFACCVWVELYHYFCALSYYARSDFAV